MQDIVVTTNPYEELLKFSANTGKELSKLDFTILGFSTTYTLEGESKQVSEKELNIFDDDELFLNEKLELHQSYKIKITELNEASSKLSSSISLQTNKDISSLILCLDLSELNFNTSLAMEILQDVYKKMIKDGFFLSIRIFDFKNKLINILSKFKDNKLKQKKVKILIAKGVKTVSAEQEKLIFVYQDKARKVHGVNKVSIIGIKEGELAFKHIKPGKSRKGRNLKLSFIEAREPKENKIDFSCSENFELKQKTNPLEQSQIDEYIAKKSGFISETAGKFDIETELNLSSVNFKDTGIIYAGLDTGVSLNIKNASQIDEAVGSGVYIECENVHITGNIAGNTNIKAKNLKIYGQTHSKSSIEAENAYISLHKGHLQSNIADIDVLENAYVKADTAKIKKTLGSTVEANKALIMSISSNNNIIFTQTVVIEHCEGTNNKFLVNIQQKDKDYEKRLLEIKTRIEKIPNIIHSLQSDMSSSKVAVEKIIKQIDYLKSQGQKIPMNFLQIVRDYQSSSKEVQALVKEEADLKLEAKDLIAELAKLQESLFEAKLINKDGKWTDMNEIKFKFIYPNSTILYSTRANDNIKLLMLEKDLDDNAKPKIVHKNEFDEKDTKW
ncbi:flagellar assembly protein A [Campylobacter avium]|uniref:flagellar assembly protein A n=1 Tax=Campylobacter avium TaxID=522485 RepID=UPI00255BB0EF|nr:flagellar assembly protein A [Campylobacter avium]